MNGTLTTNELLSTYNLARDKKKQLEILADLEGTTVEEIAAILEGHGVNPLEQNCTLPSMALNPNRCDGRCVVCGWNTGEVERRNRQIRAEMAQHPGEPYVLIVPAKEEPTNG